MVRPRRHLVVLDPPSARGTLRSDCRRGGAPTIDDDQFHDECGVFGIFGHPEAANMTYLGLHALQHRGQESAGIVTSDGEQLYAHRAMGLVQDAFTQDSSPSSRADGDRARPLLHGGRLAPQERAAHRGRLRARLARRLPQRQPHERRRAPRRARGARVDLPVVRRHRGASSTSSRVSNEIAVEDADRRRARPR